MPVSKFDFVVRHSLDTNTVSLRQNSDHSHREVRSFPIYPSGIVRHTLQNIPFPYRVMNCPPSSAKNSTQPMSTTALRRQDLRDFHSVSLNVDVPLPEDIQTI